MIKNIKSALRRLASGGGGSKRRRGAKNIPVRDGQVMAAGNGVMIQDNFLSEEDFIRVQRWAMSVPCDLDRDKRRWSMKIVLDFEDCMSSRQWSTAEEGMPAEAQLYIDAVRKTGMLEPDAKIAIGVLRWRRMSGMGEHADAHTDTAVTFYLNDTWKNNWCGDFIFYESMSDYRKGFGRSVMPVPNRLVINKSTVMHKVTYCSKYAVERVTLQAFVLKDD